MGFAIGILTFVMVVDSLALILLVLIQLPKKEAGAGLAFGGAATDALFGAGSGNVLTKITKYAAGIFFGLAVLLSIMQSYHYRHSSTTFQNLINQAGTPTPTRTAPPTATPHTPPSPALVPPAGSNLLAIPPQAEENKMPAATPAKPASAPAATPAKPATGTAAPAQPTPAPATKK
jgi:preprotein translocase subunit SecG